MTSLQELVTIARMCAYHENNPFNGNTFLEYDKMTSESFTFMATSSMQVSKSFHHLTKRIETPPELALDLELGYVGTASLNSIVKVIHFLEEN